MKKFVVITIAALTTTALSTSLMAADDAKMTSKEQQRTESAAMEQGSKSKDSSSAIAPLAQELSGMEVVSQNGEKIGTIESVTKSRKSGNVEFVTLSKGGISGLGDREIPIPLTALRFKENRATLIVVHSHLVALAK